MLLGLAVLPWVLWALYLIQSKKVSTFEVISDSMVPTLNFGETWLMEPPSGGYHVGDIVVFRHPHEPATLVVKRIVALEADRVALRDGHLFVNEKPSPPPRGSESALPLADHQWAIGPGEVFVAGDNRDDSTDSRDYGPIELDSIVGLLKRKIHG
jgi:signal peptidase I